MRQPPAALGTVLLIAAAVATATAASPPAASPVQIHQPVNVPDTWELMHGVAPPADTDIPLFVGLHRPNFDVISRAFRETSDPRHPRYGKHLSHAEVEQAVRAPAADIALVRAWLASAGARNIRLHRHGDSMQATVRPEGAEILCGCQLRVFKHTDTGRTAIVTSGGVRVPPEVAQRIDVVGGFTNFPAPPRQPPHRDSKTPSGVNPLVIRKTYGVSSVPSSGKRNIQAIAQFQGSFYIESDVEALCKRYNLGKCEIAKLVGDNSGGSNPFESNLDTEYITSGVSGTGVETWVFGYKGAQVTDFCSTFVKLLSDVVAGDEHPFVVSVSYGSQKRGTCDTGNVQRAEQDAQKLGAMGVTLLVASGDDGSGQFTRMGDNGGWLAPSWPSSMTAALAVGSTFFQNGDSGPEEATRRFGSGGGFSPDYVMEDYQSSAVSAYLNTTALPQGVKFCVPGHGGYFTPCKSIGRATPDVSFLGDGFDVIAEGTNWTVGGTSASTPGMAALISLLNEARLASGNTTLGFVNPLFYQHPEVFTDITVGTNAEEDASHHGGKVGWNCEKGWDAVSGLGTPNFPKLLELVQSLA